jgi:hypothetical protein
MKNFANLSSDKKLYNEFYKNVESNHDVNIFLSIDDKNKTDFFYKEVMNFENIAFNKDCVYGFLPNQKSSSSLNTFLNDKSYRKTYSCHLIYGTNNSYFVLRSNINNIEFSSTFYEHKESNAKKFYKNITWNTKKRDFELIYDTKEKNSNDDFIKLVKGIESGRKTKISFTHKELKFILTPYILYSPINNKDKNFISCKIRPIILEINSKNLKKVEEVELFINTMGKISVLKNKIYNTSFSLFDKLCFFCKRFLPRKESETILSIDTKWYLER